MKAKGSELTDARYIELERPSENAPVTYFSAVAPGLFNRILNMCALPGKMCANEMMAIDARGGGGIDSRENFEKLKYDDRHLKMGDEAPAATTPGSGRPARSNEQPQGMQPRPDAPAAPAPAANPHSGHAMPGMNQPAGAPAPGSH